MSKVISELGDVCRIVGGGTPSKSNPKFYGGNIPWATVRDMNRDVLIDTELKITKEAVNSSSTNIIPQNNVIIATRVGLGKVSIITQDTAINQDLRGVIPIDSNKLDVKYLFYWFKSISQEIIDAGRGATVHGVTLPFIRTLKIPIPNIDEQRQLVKRFDSLFLEIDNAIELTSRKNLALNLLKKSSLNETFSLD